MRPESVEGLYGSIGSTLKHAFSGWKAWIISSGQEGFDAVGLKQSVRQELYNGSIPCELRGYELFAGKRDEHLQELSDAGELEPLEERGSFYREQEDFRRSMSGYRKDDRTFDSDRERRPHRGGKPYGKRPAGEREQSEDRPRRFERRPYRGRDGERSEDRPHRFERRPYRDRDGEQSEDRPRRFERRPGGEGFRHRRADSRDDRQPAFRARLDDKDRREYRSRRYDDREERPRSFHPRHREKDSEE